MNLAIELAKKGFLYTSPNPMVGAVCVKDGKIISTSYHYKFGEYHAERRCLMENINFIGAELYVNLEPCSHKGKTPPCTEIILEKGVKKVYIAHEDPNPKVKGIEVLREKGVDVEVGILREKAIELNQAFLCNIEKRRPYVTLKIATSLDGKIASYNGSSRGISSEEVLKYVHLLRAENDAILVGIGTVLMDNPELTVRLGGYKKRIRRVILDSNLRFPIESKLFNTRKKGEIIIFTSKDSNENKKHFLIDNGIDVREVGRNEEGGIDIKEVLSVLFKMGVGKLLVEGGSKIAASFLRSRNVDVFIQEIAINKILGGGYSYSNSLKITSVSNSEIIKKWKTFDLDDNIIIEGVINVYGYN